MAWGEGHTNKAPRWFDDLAIAEDWGIKPWEVKDIPYTWYARWRARRMAQERRAVWEAGKWQKP